MTENDVTFDLRDAPLPSDAALDAAAQALDVGGFAIVPTGRWYMICCDAQNQRAADQIFTAKQRPKSAPLLTVLPEPGVSCAQEYFQTNRYADLMIEELWPCGLVLRLPWKDTASAERYNAGDMASSLVAGPGSLFGKVAQTLGRPLTATSVNIAGPGQHMPTSPAISPAEVDAFLAGASLANVCNIRDGIQAEFNHLTVVSCLTPEQCLFERPGVVNLRAIELALADLSNDLSVGVQVVSE